MSCADLEKLPLGDRIREARLEKGYSQRALGEALGTSRRHVLDWEKGKYGPSAEYAAKLAEVLGCGGPEFWRGEGQRPRRRDEEAMVQRMESLTESMEQTLGEVLRLLTEIRNSVVPPPPPQDGDSPGSTQ